MCIRDSFGSDALPAMTVDARGGTFVLGPTHEEVVTVTVGSEVDSYRQLPVTVYQIQVKFRDEARPRFGLLRTRELIMADAYSFDVDKEAMQESYRTVFDAYLRIFDRLGLEVTPVEAASGAIGGDINHEFMVPSAVGEDHFVSCPACGYAANVEASTRGGAGVAPTAGGGDGKAPVVEHHTPERPGIDDMVAFFGDRQVTAADLLKSMAVFDAEGHASLVLLASTRASRPPASSTRDGCPSASNTAMLFSRSAAVTWRSPKKATMSSIPGRSGVWCSTTGAFPSPPPAVVAPPA